MRKPLLIAAAAGGAALAFGLGMIVIGPMLSPKGTADGRPALEPTPSLQPITRVSVVVAPAAVALPAIRDAIEAVAPRNFTGKRENPIGQVLSKADIGWTVERGPFALAGKADALNLTTPFTGTFRITGQIGTQLGNLGGAIGNLLGGNVGQQMQNLTGKAFDQSAELRGNVVVTSHPALTSAWRLNPNLSAQVNLGSSTLNVAGIKIDVPNEVKPYLDRSVNEQIAALQARMQDDPFIEQAARREWATLCRSVPLAAAGSGMPNLWLEVRPTRAFAAQPSVDANAVNLQMGVQAETRVVPSETKPDCPFPGQLQIVPQLKQGQVHIAVPIDLPLTDVNRLIAAQLTGRTFPEDGSGSVAVTVRGAEVMASGARLLIALKVNVRERKFFSFGAEATVYIWGRPLLDKEQQILRLTDISLDVQSEAAFGLLSTAAKAATPFLKSIVAEKAVVDLKPFAADARKRIAASVEQLSRQGSGVRVDASIGDLRLVGIDFDAKTLRLITEADGSVAVAVAALALP